MIRGIFAEQKRMDILINKTREEIAKDYVTREQMEQTFQRIIDSIERIDEKIDRLQTKTYFKIKICINSNKQDYYYGKTKFKSNTQRVY